MWRIAPLSDRRADTPFQSHSTCVGCMHCGVTRGRHVGELQVGRDIQDMAVAADDARVLVASAAAIHIVTVNMDGKGVWWNCFTHPP